MLRYTNYCMQFWCWRVSVFSFSSPFPYIYIYIYMCVCVCVCLTNKKIKKCHIAELQNNIFGKCLFLKLLSVFFFFWKMQVAGIFFLTTKAFFFNPKFQNEEFLLVVNSNCSKILSMVQIQDSCSDTKINDWLS